MAEAGVTDGCQVIVNPMAEVNNGDIVVAEWHGERMVKWLYWTPDDGGELRSSSLRYPPRLFTKDDIDNGNMKIMGKVVKCLNNPVKGQ